MDGCRLPLGGRSVRRPAFAGASYLRRRGPESVLAQVRSQYYEAIPVHHPVTAPAPSSCWASESCNSTHKGRRTGARLCRSPASRRGSMFLGDSDSDKGPIDCFRLVFCRSRGETRCAPGLGPMIVRSTSCKARDSFRGLLVRWRTAFRSRASGPGLMAVE